MHGVSAVAEVLKREGVEYLFAFPAQPLIEECARIGIEPILCRQERVGMGIADGFSRTTNGKRLGVFAMQQGPGAENAYPGAAQAFGDNVPILLLPGGVATERAHVSPEYDSVESYRTVIKYGARINRIDRIPDLMRTASLPAPHRQGQPGSGRSSTGHVDRGVRRRPRLHPGGGQQDRPGPRRYRSDRAGSV